MLPIQEVEREGFKQLVNTLDPRFTVPGRKYFSKTALPNLYDSCRQTLMNELQKVPHFATTMDLWSSRTSEPYQSMTVHFIDENTHLKEYGLIIVIVKIPQNIEKLFFVHIAHPQSRSRMRVYFIELTVPWEDLGVEAYERKKLRYVELGAEAEQQGWKVRICPVEVGCRGFVAKSVGSWV